MRDNGKKFNQCGKVNIMGFDFSLVDVEIEVGGINRQNKRLKGKSLLEFPENYTVIDLETTGTDPRYDEIIEIACLKYRAGVEVDRYVSFVKPRNGASIPGFITALTGITNEMVEKAPSFLDIADNLWDFLEGEIIVGHNVNFDINFLYDMFLQTDGRIFDNDYVDTLRISRWVLKELSHHRLTDLCDYYDIIAEHHRACSDCESTNLVFQKLNADAKAKNVSFKRTYSHNKQDLKLIKGDESFFQKDHPFYGKTCVFTGKLERFSRKDAAQIVCNIGGECGNNVTKKTNYLILGDFDYCSNIQGEKSSKLKKAESLILEGQDLQIISEATFYSMLEDSFDTTQESSDENLDKAEYEKRPLKVKVKIKR